MLDCQLCQICYPLEIKLLLLLLLLLLFNLFLLLLSYVLLCIWNPLWPLFMSVWMVLLTPVSIFKTRTHTWNLFQQSYECLIGIKFADYKLYLFGNLGRIKNVLTIIFMYTLQK